MLTRSLVCLSTFVLLAEGSCCDNPPPPPAGSGAGQVVVDSGPCPSSETRTPPSDTCPAGRQVVARPPGGCEALGEQGWAHTELGSHCVYAFVGPDAKQSGPLDEPTFRSLQHGDPKGETLSQLLGVPTQNDCVTLPAGAPSSQLPDRKPLATEFETSLQRSDPLGSAPVRVAVIDTAPQSRPNARSLHGVLMAMIIESLTRGGAVEVLTYPGLPRDRSGKPNLDEGGYYGYQSDLAFAIADALTDWEKAGPGAGPLILNLSVGWDPTSSGDSGLVPEQLVRARCAGALIFAAVGNRHPRACTNGPTGPASLASSPSAVTCEATGKPPSSPLVVPISPVDHAGQPLDLARANAPLAALGVDAVVPLDDRYYGPMSGSSVATAVVSGIAARAWTNNPGLAANDLTAELYRSGLAKGTPVDASVLHDGWEEQRVVGLVDHERRPSGEVASAKVTEVTLDKEAQCRDACGVDETVWWSGTQANLFATTSSAWVVPQPDDIVCPSCKIDKNKLIVSISSAYPASAVDVRVTFWTTRSVTETIHFGAQSIPYEGSGTLPLTNAELCTVGSGSSGTTPRAAYVEFVFADAAGGHFAVGNAINVSSGTPCP